MYSFAFQSKVRESKLQEFMIKTACFQQDTDAFTYRFKNQKLQEFMIKTACFQWDTDVFIYLRSQMTASESSISYFLCFPLIFLL